MDIKFKIVIITICICLALASLSLLRSFKRLVRNSSEQSNEATEKQLKKLLFFAGAIFLSLIGLTVLIFVNLK